MVGLCEHFLTEIWDVCLETFTDRNMGDVYLETLGAREALIGRGIANGPIVLGASRHSQWPLRVGRKHRQNLNTYSEIHHGEKVPNFQMM